MQEIFSKYMGALMNPRQSKKYSAFGQPGLKKQNTLFGSKKKSLDNDLGSNNSDDEIDLSKSRSRSRGPTILRSDEKSRDNLSASIERPQN